MTPKSETVNAVTNKADNLAGLDLPLHREQEVVIRPSFGLPDQEIEQVSSPLIKSSSFLPPEWPYESLTGGARKAPGSVSCNLPVMLPSHPPLIPQP